MVFLCIFTVCNTNFLYRKYNWNALSLSLLDSLLFSWAHTHYFRTTALHIMASVTLCHPACHNYSVAAKKRKVLKVTKHFFEGVGFNYSRIFSFRRWTWNLNPSKSESSLSYFVSDIYFTFLTKSSRSLLILFIHFIIYIYIYIYISVVTTI